jgi:hypothetical protein
MIPRTRLYNTSRTPSLGRVSNASLRLSINDIFILIMITFPPQRPHRNSTVSKIFLLGSKELLPRKASTVVSDLFVEGTVFCIVSARGGIGKLHDAAISFGDGESIHGSDDKDDVIVGFHRDEN